MTDRIGNGLVTGNSAVLDPVNQNFYTPLGHNLCRLDHCGKLGNQETAQRQSVKSHNGNILRNPQTIVVQRPDSADCHNISSGKQCGEGPAGGDELLGGVVAILTGIANPLVIQLLIVCDGVIPERLQAAFVAKTAGV